MEQETKSLKIRHQLDTIQFTDSAIENLKWNKRTEKRQRIKIKFKNAPKGISLRWSPRTNKKVFQLIFRFEGKTIFHDCGEYTPGVFTCSALQEYLIKLNSKHKNKDGTYKTNPNVSLITKDQLNKSQKKTVRQVIELICKDNFPRKNIRGNLSALSIKDHTRFLIGYNERREQLTFEDNDKGWGQIIFKESSNIKDWDILFKTYPKGVGCYEGENSVYDSYLGDVIIDDLLPGNIEIYLNEINRSYGQRENIRRALAYLWAYARKKGLMGPNPPINNPARKEEGGITIEKDEESRFLGSKYNELSFDKDQLNEIDRALISLRDRYPFQSECLRMMLHTGMRAEECKKLTRDMITVDDEGDPIILMKRYITKGRTNQQQRDIIYDITDNINGILQSLKDHLTNDKYKAYQFVPWLFPTTRISLEKLSNPDDYPGYAKSHHCRTKTLDDTWSAVKEITHLEGSIKTLRKAFVNLTNKTLGGAHKGKQVSKHKTEFTNSNNYDKSSRREVKKMARKVGEVLTFKR